MSAANVALSVKPLLVTCAAVGPLFTAQQKAAGASVCHHALPVIENASARVIKHSKTGMFRLVIYEFLLDFRKFRDPRTQPYCRRFMLGVCQVWTGKEICFGQSHLRPIWGAKEMGAKIQELTCGVKC